MVILGIAWIVMSPYCTGLLVGNSKRANRLVSDHLGLATAIGWAGVAALLAGVFAMPDGIGLLVAIGAAPLVGLAFWGSGPRGDDGDEPSEDPHDPPSSDDGIDWDQFEREWADWQREHERVPA
jgi:hypothetical protein